MDDSLKNAFDLPSYKDVGNFTSARWKKDNTPDFSMMTQESAAEDITTTRHIINYFPRSQHRPMMIHYGMRIPLTNSISKPRWNFLRDDWKAFADDLDHVIQFILARANSYERFAKAVVAAAKRHIPQGYRNQYIQVGMFDVMNFTKNTTLPMGVKRLLIFYKS
jgi:hypothetical protein